MRDETAVKNAIDKTVTHFGGLDIVVNNASAIKPNDLARHRHAALRSDAADQHARHIHGVEIRHSASRKGREPAHPELSPPLDMQEKWFARHTAYSIAKYGMSLVVLGLAGELRSKGIAVNALWPRTTIATAAVKNLLGGDAIMRMSRTPDILADAAHAIFEKPAKSFTGNFLIDDTFLAGEGVNDFDKYRVDPTQPLAPDFFVPDNSSPSEGRQPCCAQSVSVNPSCARPGMLK